MGGMGPGISELIGKVGYGLIPERIRSFSGLPPLPAGDRQSGLDILSFASIF